MTAEGRITSVRLTPGMKIHVEPWASNAAHVGPDYVNPTTRKRDPVTTVTAVERVNPKRGGRQARIRVTTELGVMTVAPSQTQKLAEEKP